MTNEKIKYVGLFQKLWADPVWSKVISAGIIFILGLLYSLFKTLSTQISFRTAFYETLNYPIALYKIFIFITVGLLIYGAIYKIMKRRKSRIGKFDSEQKIGEFTFRELFNALLTHTLDLPPNLVKGQETRGDLLTLFILYQRQFNRGVEWEHDHYTYYTLGPSLMTYGLIEKTPTTNKLDSVGHDMLQTSKTGYLFHSAIERWRIYRDEILKDYITKIPDDKPKQGVQ